MVQYRLASGDGSPGALAQKRHQVRDFNAPGRRHSVNLEPLTTSKCALAALQPSLWGTRTLAHAQCVGPCDGRGAAALFATTAAPPPGRRPSQGSRVRSRCAWRSAAGRLARVPSCRGDVGDAASSGGHGPRRVEPAGRAPPRYVAPTCLRTGWRGGTGAWGCAGLRVAPRATPALELGSAWRRVAPILAHLVVTF